MKMIKIEHFSSKVLFVAALSLFISGCAGNCAPRPTPEDMDPRVAEERTNGKNWTGDLLSFEFLSIFCTKRY